MLNAGTGGYSSAHGLVNLYFRLVEFSPDVVVIMHNVNDLTVNYFGNGTTSDYGNKYMTEFFVHSSLHAGRSIKGFLNQSRLLAASGFTHFAPDEFDPDKDITKGIEYFVRNLELIAHICRQNGIKLVLLSQPTYIPYYRNGVRGLTNNFEHFEVYNKVIKETAEKNDIGFFDMFSKIGQNKEYFVDSVHYSPKGIDKFAEHLHGFLVGELFRNPGRIQARR